MHDQGDLHERLDAVAVEEPLELRLGRANVPLTLAVLMRTPGQDRHLLLGWLISEGLLPEGFELVQDAENSNVWTLQTLEQERVARSARLSVSSSACGMCGSGSIEQLAVRATPPAWMGEKLSPALLSSLPGRLLLSQTGFQASGGLHGAGLFSQSGELLCALEDVGRHNAVDKVVGWAWEHGQALDSAVLVVSSRAGFEIVQKAVTARIAVVVAVGAATSLAVDTALTFGLTLCAFTREGRFTVYSGGERIYERGGKNG